MGVKADSIILGNVITMDESKPSAEAVAVKGDRILYVGSADVARKLCDEKTQIYDFGKNSVYPGFLEAHCHSGGAGYMMAGVARFTLEDSLEEVVRKAKEYADAHPEKEVVSGLGFIVKDEMPTASMLDEICPDRPMVLTDYSGHVMWINTVAMKRYGIDRAAAEKYGTECVVVDENGDPTGYLSEGAVFHVRSQVLFTLEEMLSAVETWVHFSQSMGYTGAYTAGVNILTDYEAKAYQELEKAGKLKTYVFAGRMLQDNTETPEEDIARIAQEAEEFNSKHYRMIGAKVFCDGTVEAHTAWMLDDYLDKPGYKGISRFDDHDKMVRLVKAASEHGLNVHVHSIGDASTKAWMDAMAQAEDETGDFDMRNALAHLQCVRPEDIRRIADYNIIPVCGIMWVELNEAEYELERAFIGIDKMQRMNPIKSFIDSGARAVGHTDFPVSPAFSAPHAVCLGVARRLPSHGEGEVFGKHECISRMEALRALTTNVAYSWHEEDNMGSLEIGKLANITVFDRDFLKDDLADVENSKCVATFVDGELVYRA